MNLEKIEWKFPEKIEFGAAYEYLKKIEHIKGACTVHMDLLETDVVHSSFIGLLIVIKQKLDFHGGKLVLELSPSIKRIFNMMNILDYLDSDPKLLSSKRSA